MHVLLDRIIRSDYGQFDLLLAPDARGYDGDIKKFFGGQSNGLMGAASDDGSLYLFLGTWQDTSMRIVLLDGEPPAEPGAWDDIVEVSAIVPADGEARWATWGGHDGGPLNLPEGAYRVRTSVRGRDAALDSQYSATPTMSQYLVEFWPGPAALDAVIHTTSRFHVRNHEAPRA